MKKFFKIFSFVVVLLGLIALTICYIVIPQETKSAVDVLVGYLNTPLGTIFGTTITLGVVVGFILKLVYDRYKDSVRNDIKSIKEYADKKKEEVSEYEQLALKHKEESLNEIHNLSEKLIFLKDEIIKVCETSPNKKIKELGGNIKNSFVELENKLQERLDNANGEEKNINSNTEEE